MRLSATGVSLRVISPLQVIGGAAAGYLLLWTMAPLDFRYQGGAGPVLVLLAYALLLSAGAVTGFRRWAAATVQVHLDISRLHRFTGFVAIAGSAGLVLRVFERVFLRAGGEISADFALNRDLIATGGSGPLAFAGSLLGPLLMLLPCFVLLSWAMDDRRRIHLIYLVLGVAYPLFDLLFQGSRSTVVIFLGLLWVAAYTTRSIKFRPVVLIVAAVVAVLVIWGAGYIFWVRTTQLGMDPVNSTFASGYALFAPPNDLVLSQLRTGGVSGLGGLLYAYVHFCQYLLHGVYEFLYAATYVSAPTTYGMQTFYIPVKMVGAVAGATKPELLIQDGVLRSGIYTTLFGPILYDFGVWGAGVASFVFGFGSGAIGRAVRKGSLAWLPLYFLVMGLLPFVFVVNWFTSGTGQYMLIGSLLLYGVLRTRRFRFHVNSRGRARGATTFTHQSSPDIR